MADITMTHVRDMLYPGLRAVQGHNPQPAELIARDDRLTVRLGDGAEHTVVTAEEVQNDTWSDLAMPRLKALMASEP